MAELDSIENWLPVVDFEGLYEVSDLGRVRSLPRTYERPEWRHGIEQTVHVGGNVISGHMRMRGERKVCLFVTLIDGKKRRTARVHRLVLETFIGPAPKGMVCRHYDGDPANNALENLRWGTMKENQADSVRHGTKCDPPTFFGERHPMSKLTERAVLEIRSINYKRGDIARLARKHGVLPITISRVLRGESWPHVGKISRDAQKR